MQTHSSTYVGFLLPIVLTFFTASCGNQAPLPDTNQDNPQASDATDAEAPSEDETSDASDPADSTDAIDPSEDDTSDASDPADSTDAVDPSEDTTDATDPTLTFQVNMGSGYTGGVTVGNNVQGWDTAGMIQLIDPDSDGIYTGSMQLESGTTIEYKFIQGYNGSGSWENVPVECGLQTGSYINRVFTMPSGNTVLPVVSFSGCEPDGTDDENNDTGVCVDAPGRSVAVTTAGRQLRVGNSALHIKGVAWSPIPVGQGPGNYFADAVEADAQLMEDAGINVVRTYGAILDEAVLDELWSHGIYVMMTVFYGYSETVESTINTVCAIKHHPAILGWSVGNEWNYNNLAQDISFTQAVDKVAEVVAAIKLNDPTRPTSTVYGALPPQDVINALSNVDIWGINHYPGTSFGNFFNEWAARSSKPFYFGEYGADAYNGQSGAVDEASQSSILEGLTNEIYNNASVNNSGVCTGGMVFEFNDEWWKYNGGSHWEHNTEASWQNHGYSDPDMHEEWWGLVDVNRNPRQAYNTYRDMTAPQ